MTWCSSFENSARAGVATDNEWLNNGPQQLVSVLPAGWEFRLELIFRGSALELKTLGRVDLLKTKLLGDNLYRAEIGSLSSRIRKLD